MQPWIFTVISLLIGFSLGLIFSRLIPAGQEEKKELEQTLKEKEAELAKYKEDVSTHFSKTADLVNNLTDSYKSVHQHLASGVQALCTDETEGKLVYKPSHKLEAKTENPDITETTAADIETETINTISGDFEPPHDYTTEEQATEQETVSSEIKEQKDTLKEPA